MCKVEWCKGKPNISGNGYCRRHYDQLRKYGRILDDRSRHDANRYSIEGTTARIIITDRKDSYRCATIIDAEDLERTLKHRWTTNGNGYVRTFVGTSPVYMHRFLMDAPDGYDVDHINHDRLDNRKENLRIVKHVDNCHNRGKLRGTVRCIKDRALSRPYCAAITISGGHKHLGYYETEGDARKAIEAYLADL